MFQYLVSLLLKIFKIYLSKILDTNLSALKENELTFCTKFKYYDSKKKLAYSKILNTLYKKYHYGLK